MSPNILNSRLQLWCQLLTHEVVFQVNLTVDARRTYQYQPDCASLA